MPLGPLWEHQERTIEAVREAVREGHRSICIVLPTGGGKSVVLASIAHGHIQKGGAGVLALAHRRELIGQLYETFRETGVSVSAIAASSTLPYNPYHKVQIGSVQTLLARETFPTASLVLPDEVHHFVSDEWRKLIDRYQHALIVGCTATPLRADGRPLGDIFTKLIVGATAAELTAKGFLVPCEVIAPSKTLSKGIAMSPVDAYFTYGPGRKCIVFAANSKACDEYKRAFVERGVVAEIVSYKSPNRDAIMKAYKAGTIRVLISIAVLTEGFDDRPTDMMINARNMGNPGLWVQCLGRILRASPETGKQSALLVDLCGTVHVHGDATEEREFSLDGDGMRRKSDPVKERFCAVCGAFVEGVVLVCPDCATQRPEMVAPAILKIQLQKYGQIRKRDEGARKAHYIRMMDEGAGKGHRPGATYHRYKAAYGEDPPRAWLREWEQARRLAA